MEIKLEHLTNLLKTLSWVKIVQFLLLMIVLIFSYTAWENRQIIYNSIKVTPQYRSSSPLYIELGKDTTDYINSATSKLTNLVAGIQVISVDFKKNSRESTLFSITDATLDRAWKEYLENKISTVPLFSSNELHNQAVIDLINGNFSCRPFKESIAMAYLSKAQTSVSYVCSVSVPPYYGRFSGYLNIYVKAQTMTDIDIALVKQLSRDISLRIFEIDIKKSQHYIEG